MPAKLVSGRSYQRLWRKQLAEHLGPKPDLKLTIEGRFDPQADQAALKNQKLTQLIDSRRESAGVAAAAAGAYTLEKILETLFTEQFSAEALEVERQRVTSVTPTNATPAQNEVAPPALDAAAFYERLRSRLLEAQVVSEADLAGLASARTKAIVEALNMSGAIEPGRVIAGPPEAVKRKKAGSTRVASEIVMSAEGDE